MAKKIKIAITGATGFLGSAFCRLLKKNGVSYKISRSTLNNKKRLANELKGIETVVHIAGLNKKLENVSFFNVNAKGTKNVLEVCAKIGVKNIIFISSEAVYEYNPKKIPVKEESKLAPYTEYGKSKLVAERYCEQYRKKKIKVMILRLAILYGPGQHEGFVPARFCVQAKSKKPITIFGDGENSDDYLFIDDAAKALLAAVKNPQNTILNIGSGKATSFNQLAQTIRRLIPSTKVIHQPTMLKRRNFCLDISKARKLLKWKPSISLKEGLARQLRLK